MGYWSCGYAIDKGLRFLLCGIDIYCKYAWVTPLKNKKGITINNDFQNDLHESNCKQNKIWINKASEFYSKSMKPCLQDKKMYRYQKMCILINIFRNRNLCGKCESWVKYT